MPSYRILGACNPKLAHIRRCPPNRPSVSELPCNVVVRQDAAGAVFVEFMDPAAVFQLVDNPEHRDSRRHGARETRTVMVREFDDACRKSALAGWRITWHAAYFQHLHSQPDRREPRPGNSETSRDPVAWEVIVLFAASPYR